MKKTNLLIILCLLLLTIISRFFLLKDGIIPFQFDHGKDSLAIMDMWLNKNIKLIGPWTSIPGLYFGPAWYYLLLPAFVLGAWHPLAPVCLMVVLLLLQIYLAWKYLGKEEAIIMATAPIWIIISISSWNPFPMTLISLVILIILKAIKQKHAVNLLELFLLFFAASLGFHFSTAFAVLYPLLIVFSLFFNKIKISFKKALIALGAFILPFIPQILFELTHQFLEVKAVINYLKIGESNGLSFDKVKLVLAGLVGQFKITVLPDYYFTELKFLEIFAIIFFVILTAIAIYKVYFKKAKIFVLPAEYLFWLILSFLLFSLLHYNVWYLLSLSPLMAMIAGDILRANKKYFRFLFIFLMLLSLFCKVLYFEKIDKDKLIKLSQFLPAKLEAIESIRRDSMGADFNSYQYVSDIYDFPYQYIYFWQALSGQKLPADFSYKVAESAYIVQKSDLLNYFNQNNNEAKFNYFIIEPSDNSKYRQTWLNDFSLTNMTNLVKLDNNSNIELYRQVKN